MEFGTGDINVKLRGSLFSYHFHKGTRLTLHEVQL